MPIPAPRELADVMVALAIGEDDLRSSHHRVIVRPRDAEHRVAIQFDGALEPLRERVRAWRPRAAETKRGDAVLRQSLFRWDGLTLKVAQPPKGGPVELALLLGPDRASLDESFAVVERIAELRSAIAFARSLSPRALTAVVSLAEGWTPNAYLELDALDDAQVASARDWLASQPLRPTGDGSWQAEDGALFAMLSGGTRLRIGLTPGLLGES